jgi:hypothetical protein
VGEGGSDPSTAVDVSVADPPARDAGLEDDAGGDEATGARYPAERSRERSMVPSQGPLDPEARVKRW